MEQTYTTFQDFLMWLQGVEDMQPDGWSPDQRQWEKIREKMRSIDAAKVVNPMEIVEELRSVVQQLSDEIVGLRMRTQQPVYGPAAQAHSPAPSNPANWSVPPVDYSSDSILPQQQDAIDGSYRPAFI